MTWSHEVKLCAKAVTSQKAKLYQWERRVRRKGRGWEAFREQRHEQCLQQQTSYNVSYICTSCIHLAKGVDHVPVSHHAAVEGLSVASHYFTCYIGRFMLHSNLQLHCSTTPKGNSMCMCVSCLWLHNIYVQYCIVYVHTQSRIMLDTNIQHLQFLYIFLFSTQFRN